MNDLSVTGDGQRKSMWSKPGGTLGRIILVLLGVIVVLNASGIFAFLIECLKNTITTIALIVSLIILGYVVLNPKTWKVLETGYLLICRKITSWFVTVDPIGIIREHVEDMKKRMVQMQNSLGKINGIIRNSESRLKEYQSKLDDATRKYQYYKNSQKEKFRASDQAMLINTYTQVINSRKSNLEKSRKWQEVLRILYNYSDSKVKATEEYCNVKEEEYKLVKEEYKAFSSAMSALKGDPDKLAMFNMALDKVDDEILTKTGIMDEVLNETGGLLSQIDADQAISNSKADEILNQYENGTGIFASSSWSNSEVGGELPNYYQESPSSIPSPEKKSGFKF